MQRLLKNIFTNDLVTIICEYFKCENCCAYCQLATFCPVCATFVCKECFYKCDLCFDIICHTCSVECQDCWEEHLSITECKRICINHKSNICAYCLNICEIELIEEQEQAILKSQYNISKIQKDCNALVHSRRKIYLMPI